MTAVTREITENALRTIAESVPDVPIADEDWPAIVAIVRSLAQDIAPMRAHEVRQAEPAMIFSP